MVVYADRRDAGKRLASALERYQLTRPVILALPRGGVPVAYEVAAALGAELDIILVRKLGAPAQPELAIGAVASGGVRVLNEDLIAGWPGLDEAKIEQITAREQRELERREMLYRGDRPYPDLSGRDVVLVDDGLATGATMRAAAKAVKTAGAASIVVAVPVGAAGAVRALAAEVDDVVCLDTPEPFMAIGYFYRDFGQTTDREVCALLDRSRGGARTNRKE